MLDAILGRVGFRVRVRVQAEWIVGLFTWVCDLRKGLLGSLSL